MSQYREQSDDTLVTIPVMRDGRTSIRSFSSSACIRLARAYERDGLNAVCTEWGTANMCRPNDVSRLLRKLGFDRLQKNHNFTLVRADAERIREMVFSGMSFRAVATAAGFTAQTVANCLRPLVLLPPALAQRVRFGEVQLYGQYRGSDFVADPYASTAYSEINERIWHTPVARVRMRGRSKLCFLADSLPPEICRTPVCEMYLAHKYSASRLSSMFDLPSGSIDSWLTARYGRIRQLTVADTVKIRQAIRDLDSPRRNMSVYIAVTRQNGFALAQEHGFDEWLPSHYQKQFELPVWIRGSLVRVRREQTVSERVDEQVVDLLA